MNAEQFFELMNTLPDDMLVSAVRSEPKQNRKPMYIISAVAACLIVGVTAVVYPKLKVQPPEIREPDVTVTETTTATGTTETSVTMPSAVSVTGSESNSVSLSASSSAEITQTASTSQTVSTGNSSAASDSAQSSSRTTEIAQTTKDTSQTKTTTAFVTQTDTTQAVTVTESLPQTTPAETDETTTAANAMQTDTIVDDTGTVTETTTRTETEMPLDFWILKQEVMAKEPKHRIREWNLYREGLPDDFAYETVPDIDFSRYDCLIVHFSVYTYIDDPPLGYYPISQNYRITIYPVYDKPVGTTEEYVIAFPIPKSLYADTAPEGLLDIQMGDGISGSTGM
ncbi:MAG: hypothetical protein J6S92_14415, partial [Oscillospiraceae bacterium]|nr:hypothetical protein [Oscillospiraceae bacterium]